MKKVLALLLIFSMILGNFTVFAESEILGSITVNHIDKDSLEVLETEILADLEMGEHIVTSKLISGYELADTVTKLVYLEEGKEHQDINFEYVKIPEVPQYDNLVHVIQLDSDGNEISRESRYVDWETTEYFDIATHYEDKLLHNPTVVDRIAEGTNWSFNYTIIGDKLRVENLAKEEDNADFTYTIIIQYEKFQPKINVVYWDGYEILDTEIFEYESLGLKTINIKNFDGYELLEEDVLEVELEYPNFEVETWIKYNKIPDVIENPLEFDNLVHITYVNQETGEVFFAKSYPAPIGETYQIPITMFYEDEMLEVDGTDGGWMVYSDYPFEDEFMPYELDYYNIDENYLSNLTIFIPSSEENNVYSYTMNIPVIFKKVIPQVLVKYFDGEELLDSELIEFDSLGEKTITAKEIEGYEVIGDKTKVIEFKFPDNKPFYVHIVNFEYKKIDDKTIPIPTHKPLPPKFEPKQPTIPTITEAPEEEPEEEPEETIIIENIPEGKFVSRWKGHKIIEKPIKIETKQIVEFEFPNEVLEKEGLQPRLYKWNEEKQKWVALATKIDGNKVKSYEKVEGYIAVFGVKQPRFNDVEGNEWFAEKLDRANGFAIVEGIKVGEQIKLDAEKELTRKELYAMVGRIFGAVPKGETSLYNELDYIVVKHNDEWFEPYFAEFYKKGIADRVFTKEEANEKVTRLEVLELLTTMISRVEKIEMVDLNSFKDTKELNTQIAEIVKGFPDNTLRPHQEVTRIETITFLVNALEKLGW